jgi:hypothetical protein
MVLIMQVPVSLVQSWKKVLGVLVAYATIFGHLKYREVLYL